jgi:hypothetical protein
MDIHSPHHMLFNHVWQSPPSGEDFKRRSSAKCLMGKGIVVIGKIHVHRNAKGSECFEGGNAETAVFERTKQSLSH